MKNNFNKLIDSILVELTGKSITCEYKYNRYIYTLKLFDTEKTYRIYSFKSIDGLHNKENKIILQSKSDSLIALIQTLNYEILSNNIYKINRVKK